LSDDFLILNYEKAIKKITSFISDQVRTRKKNGVIVGLSGGIDSSVSVKLASRALENNRIIGLIMPEKKATPKTDIENARTLAKKLRVKYKVIQIERGTKILLNRLPKDKLAGGNFFPNEQI
jgi:NAD+ synthase